jgi:hypothetical protein
MLMMVVCTKGIVWEKCVRLENIQSCTIVNDKNEENGHTRVVLLQLTMDNEKDKILFPLFDEEVDDVRDLSRRVKQSRYWQRKIRCHASIPVA